MSSKTRSHDVVCGFREAKMESSAGEGGGISKASRGLIALYQTLKLPHLVMTTISNLQKHRTLDYPN